MPTTTFTLEDLLTPDEAFRLKQGRVRLLAAGIVSLAVYDSHMKLIIKEEHLQDVWSAMTMQLLEHYPMLLLSDPDYLSGALRTATFVGLLLGSQYSFPPELIALLRPEIGQETNP